MVSLEFVGFMPPLIEVVILLTSPATGIWGNAGEIFEKNHWQALAYAYCFASIEFF